MSFRRVITASPLSTIPLSARTPPDRREIDLASGAGGLVVTAYPAGRSTVDDTIQRMIDGGARRDLARPVIRCPDLLP